MIDELKEKYDGLTDKLKDLQKRKDSIKSKLQGVCSSQYEEPMPKHIKASIMEIEKQHHITKFNIKITSEEVYKTHEELYSMVRVMQNITSQFMGITK